MLVSRGLGTTVRKKLMQATFVWMNYRADSCFEIDFWSIKTFSQMKRLAI